MPKFKLNKLVRDKLPADYEKTGQKATYRELTPSEHKSELIRKIIEEASEINVYNSNEEITGEIADIQQVLDDLAFVCGIDQAQINLIKQAKNDKKGGFKNGAFVDTLELADEDEWVQYYRKRPDVFPEE